MLSKMIILIKVEAFYLEILNLYGEISSAKFCKLQRKANLANIKSATSCFLAVQPTE